MPSSTSSSEALATPEVESLVAEPEAPRPPAPTDARRSALRTLAVGLAVLVASCGLVRGFTAFAERRDPYAFGTTHPRVERIVEVIPEIAARPGPTAIAIGSSQILNGFDPVVFDESLKRAGKELTSYSLSFNALTPASAHRILSRLRAAYGASGRKPELLVLEFPTFMATRAAVKMGMDDGPNMQLGTAETFLADARRSFGTAFTAAAYHYLVGGLEPTLVKEWIAGEIYGEKMPCGVRRLKSGEDAGDAGITAFCADLKKVFPERLPTWYEPSRGYRKMVFPETEASYRGMTGYAKQPSFLEADLAWRVRCCDIQKLDYSPAALDDFTSVAKQAKALAQRVMVVIPPINAAWVKRAPEGAARLRRAIEAFERQTGLRVIDWSEDPEFEPGDFVDTTHLDGLGGAKKLSAKMAEAAKEIL